MGWIPSWVWGGRSSDRAAQCQGGALPHGLLRSRTQGFGAEEQGRASLDARGACVHLGPFNAAPPSSGSDLLSCSLFRLHHGWRGQAGPCPAGREEASGHSLVSLSGAACSLQGKQATGCLVQCSGFP